VCVWGGGALGEAHAVILKHSRGLGRQDVVLCLAACKSFACAAWSDLSLVTN